MGIPFAPFLALGGVVALFAGHELMHAYLALSGR
jgi:prepilin signal peptidase PulO-like enzyme (type II secretory pathway)